MLTKALSRRGDTEIILLLDKEPNFTLDVAHVEIRVIQPKVSKGLPYISRLTNRRIEEDTFRHQGRRALLFFSNYLSLELAARAKTQHIPLALWINGDSLTDDSGLVPDATKRIYDGYIKSADAIVVQNEYQKQTLQRFHQRESDLVMPCIVEPPQSTQESEELKSSDYCLGETPRLLWVARSSGVKRPWMLVRLADLLPEFSITAIMSPLADEPFSRTIKYDLLHRPTVTVIDGMPHEQLAELYREDVIVINTSASEGLPNTFIEAAQAQRPFVSFEVDLGGLLDDGSQEDSCGLCARGDLNLMVQQIRELAADPVRRLHIGQNAERYASEQWNADKVAAEFIAFMDTL